MARRGARLLTGALKKGVAPRGCRPRTGSHLSTTQRACVNKRKDDQHPDTSGLPTLDPAISPDLGLWLATVEELVKNPHAELQGRDRNSLIDAMEHAGEVQLCGQPERREPEAANAKPGE